MQTTENPAKRRINPAHKTHAPYCVFSDRLTFNEAKAVERFARKKSVCLAENGKTDYVILLPDKNTTEELRRAAEFLSDILGKMTGARFNVITESLLPRDKKFFSLGDTLLSQSIDTSGIANVRGNNNDGFVTVSLNGNIFIKGINSFGTANGIYAFPEDYLEVMYARVDYTYIPKCATLYMDEIPLTVNNPDFDWRNAYYRENWALNDGVNNMNEKLRLNGVENNGGWRGWGTGSCHTAYGYAPSFEEAPDCYALIDGKRCRQLPTGDFVQLCYSNVYEKYMDTVKASFKKAVESKPGKIYFDFSMMDNDFYCQCDNCRRYEEKYGKSGAMMLIVNELAKACPDVTVTTLAYFDFIEPPLGIVCEPNVQITLAIIKHGQYYDYLTGDYEKAASLRKIIKGWGAISKHIFLWDYLVDFAAYSMPYPNFAVQKNNETLYKENNVTAVFHQCVSQTLCSDMSNLKNYYIAKLLWNKDTDIEKLIGKYLVVTYGDAASLVAEYLDKLQYYCATRAESLDLYDSVSMHTSDYLSKESIEEYEAIIGKAYKSVEGNETLRARIEEIFISIYYAKSLNKDFCEEVRLAAANKYMELAEKHKLTEVREFYNLGGGDNFFRVKDFLSQGFKE